jgi:mannose-6-phosphate isomerase-like protein (cupin superfamily)
MAGGATKRSARLAKTKIAPPSGDTMAKVGRGNPPKHMQFQKGVSGNKEGRPKGSKNLSTLIMEAARDQVTATIDGKQRKITKIQATAMQLATKAAGDHMNEQITWITEGVAEVYSQGQKFIMKAGDIMVIPPNVPHEFIFTEDTIDIDIFAPGRQDWLDGTATYLKSK